MLVGFGLRTWLHYRQTGDAGFRGFAGGAVERAAAILLAAGLILAPVAPILELIGWLAPAAVLDRPATHAAGAAAFLLGLAVTLVAQVSMGASWRIGVRSSERTSLVTHGLFRYVRNPIFTGTLLALAGLVLLVPNPVSAIAGLCALAGLELQVRRVEEPHLLRTHGDVYRAYMRSAGRFLPGLGRLRR